MMYNVYMPKDADITIRLMFLYLAISWHLMVNMKYEKGKMLICETDAKPQ